MADAHDKAKIRSINGGRKITIGDTEIDVISSYSPSWIKEYTDPFTTWDGREVKKLKSVRFRLTFSTYGIQPEELTALLAELKTDETTLECDEFSGTVRCDSISPELKNANFYGDFFSSGSVTLTSTDAELPEDGL